MSDNPFCNSHGTASAVTDWLCIIGRLQLQHIEHVSHLTEVYDRHTTPVWRGSASVQVLVSVLRQLEGQLSLSGLQPSSFHAQALQGIMHKLLVPLLNPKTLLSHVSNSTAEGGTAGSEALQGLTGQQQRLLRLLLLPGRYNPGQLPEGRQLLPGFAEDVQPGAAAPVHLPVEKDGVRLQTSGEALYAGDIAARMKGRVLYLAGTSVLKVILALLGLSLRLAEHNARCTIAGCYGSSQVTIASVTLFCVCCRWGLYLCASGTDQTAAAMKEGT